MLIAAIGAALMVAIGAAAWWFVWVPNWRPPLRDGERYGVDVSHHQGQIDWSAVAADDIDFAYIKSTEGADHTDPAFARNWRGAKDAGLDRGAYHFYTLCRGGAEQAVHFLSIAPPDAVALAPAVDLELAGNCDTRPAPETVDAELRVFLDRVETAWGRPALLYVGADFSGRYQTAETLGRPLWLVRFLRRPDDDAWRVWQLHGFAKVDGIRGQVDLDISRDSP